MIEYRLEKWVDAKDDIIELSAKHYKECKIDDSDFEPDDNAFSGLCENGKLQILTARNNGKLVGYLINVISRHMLFDKICSFHIGWFVKAEFRRKLVGLELLKKGEEYLKNSGVKKMYGSHTMTVDASKAFDRLNWQLNEKHYIKEI